MKHYTDIAFFISDVNTIQNTIKTQFDISCLFNSFYSFHNQEQALYSLNLVTKTGGTLVIFDYLDLCTATKNPLIKNNCQLPFIPINLNTIEKMLLKTGWVLSKRKIVNDEYEKWYTNLVTTILANKEKIIEKFGKSIYDSAYCKYKLLLDATTNKTLGGIIVYAQKLK